MTRFALLASLACAGFGGSAYGVDYVWNNTSTDLTSPGSWTPAGVPLPADRAYFNVLGTFGAGTINNPVLNVPAQVTQISTSNNAMFQGWSLTGSGGLASGSATVSGLVTRGFGTTTIDLGTGAATSLSLTGATGAALNGAIDVGSGSTLLLTGNTIGSLPGGSAISLRGGTLIQDNSAGNPAGGQRLTGTGQINLAGGGSTLEFRSASGGTDFTGLSGILSLGAGDATIRANQTGSGVLNITFGQLVRTNTAATINFTSTGSGTLGGGGVNDPTIKFTTAPFLTNGVIANAAGSSALGFAVYNGTDFAGYDATRGVIAATSVGVSGALSTAATQNSNLTGNASIAASTIVAYNSLKISPTTAGQSLAIGSGGMLDTVAILLSGTTDYTISGGAIGGNSGTPNTTRNIHVTNPNTSLLTSASLAGRVAPINKAGDGFLVLTGTANQVAFASGSLNNFNLTGGVLRATSTNFNLTVAFAPILRFRGGVIEYDVSAGNTLFDRSLGIATGTVNWSQGAGSANAGSGGFSAFSTDPTRVLTVNLGGASAQVIWGGSTLTNPQFVQDGYALKFGSTKSNATVVFQNDLALDSSSTFYLVREVNVTKGVGNIQDHAVLGGIITGSPTTDLLKTGNGVLSLTRPNTYEGNTLIHAGTLTLSGGINATLGTGSVAVGKGAVLAGIGTITPSSGNAVVVNPGGAIRGGDVASTSDVNRTGTLLMNSNVTINSTSTDRGTIQFEADRTGTNAVTASQIALGAGFNLNLNPGVGNKFAIELVTSSVTAPVNLNEAYTVTLASVGTGGSIQYNGTPLSAGTNIAGVINGGIIDPSLYVFQSSSIPAFTNVQLTIGAGDQTLNLSFTPVPVPEPATVLGLASGVFGLGALVRRRIRSRAALAA